MFIEATLARHELARNFSTISYPIEADAWKKLCMAVKRDIQAKRLRPNVPVPSRRNLLAYLRMMSKETGSITGALQALVHDGPWTSSGGSFRLAEKLGIDIPDEAQKLLARNGQFRMLEIGAAWAGFRARPTDGKISDIASLGDALGGELGRNAFLHFTNLTPWHTALPDGVAEHPYVTAAGLKLLERQGVRPGSVDILYSQAAAYFETDHKTFMKCASDLIAPGGIMIFNHRPEIGDDLDRVANQEGLELSQRSHLGGMNGDVARYDRMRASTASLPPVTTRNIKRVGVGA